MRSYHDQMLHFLFANFHCLHPVLRICLHLQVSLFTWLCVRWDKRPILILCLVHVKLHRTVWCLFVEPKTTVKAHFICAVFLMLSRPSYQFRSFWIRDPRSCTKRGLVEWRSVGIALLDAVLGCAYPSMVTIPHGHESELHADELFMELFLSVWQVHLFTSITCKSLLIISKYVCVSCHLHGTVDARLAIADIMFSMFFLRQKLRLFCFCARFALLLGFCHKNGIREFCWLLWTYAGGSPVYAINIGLGRHTGQVKKLLAMMRNS